MSWQTFLLSADCDFVSHILCSYYGLKLGTSLWMSMHSIEKYLKALLLKNDSSFNPRKYSHRIEELWNKSKDLFPNEYLFQTPEFDTYILEINNQDKNPDIRYGFGIDSQEPNCTRIYTMIACTLRILILGDEEYRKRGNYGISDMCFGGCNHFFEDPIISAKEIVIKEVDRLTDLK
ncbi:HEPN domain-containing protein [Carboxylicivirga marina]|uniref:HEPN domain-containing protein n=1 Tax=Carboxylicivirga marina TaxID=2800988 RepID=A0ABS1HRJ6_9BACT|nr:hypothetical protein [Carboxylicivirga marina]MBK3519799.1 hypothetical protein [Carboxylicivirga marina]